MFSDRNRIRWQPVSVWLVVAATFVPIVAVAEEEAQGDGVEAADSCAVTVVVVGLVTSEGMVKVALSNSEDDYRAGGGRRPFKSAALPIKDGGASHLFRPLPCGTYAVKLFHDRNDNNRLDTSFLGIPREPYGFSNNAHGRFGPPSFEEASFGVSSSADSIGIEVPE